MTDAPWELDVIIPSESEYGFQIIRQVTDQLASLAWSEPEVFGIHLALEEALINAIKHGNECQSNKTVHVNIVLTHDEFRGSVTDQGSGFDPEAVPDPTCENNVCRDCGRGIALMREFMDEVRFVGCGNRVEMSRQRRQ